MLLTPNNTEEWLAYRKEHKLPHPPLEHIHKPTIWFLAIHHMDGLLEGKLIWSTLLQWNPRTQQWHNLDEQSKRKGLDMVGYRTVAALQIPYIPTYKELAAINDERKAY